MSATAPAGTKLRFRLVRLVPTTSGTTDPRPHLPEIIADEVFDFDGHHCLLIAADSRDGMHLIRSLLRDHLPAGWSVRRVRGRWSRLVSAASDAESRVIVAHDGRLRPAGAV